MTILSVKDLAKMGRDKPLFSDVTFGLEEGDKAALIGRNGTGKSTMLLCIAGLLAPDNGTAVFNSQAGVSFLPQNPEYNPEHTIREHIFMSRDAREHAAGVQAQVSETSPKLSIIHEYEELCARLAEAGGEDDQRLHQRFEYVSHLMNDKDLWTYEAEVKSILTTLGISAESGALDRKMKELSGGMIKKVALAQVLVEDTKLLLLDEPTNHLDIRTITWLEDYLRNTKRSVLMVTHDRYFLDSVCSTIYELEHGKFNKYVGNFSTYLEKKQTELEIAENTERRIESVLRVERDWLMRGPCARGTKARARVDNIHRMINREKLQKDKGFTFEVAGRRLGGKILEAHDISKNYVKAGSSGGTSVIADFSYMFKKGERIGIFGDNGTGKSTLLNMLTGSLAPDSGSVEKGLNTVFGYYQQNPVFADTSLTVTEYLKEAAEYITRNDGKTLSAGQLLEEFGFEGRILHSAVSTLSGGERKRLFLIRLLLSNPNFLVLDEPTNDFDIFTMSILESFLETYQGCILVVSHDRCFMDKVADTLFILEDDGSVSGYVGKCTEYLDYLKECEAEKAAAARESASKNGAANKASSASKSGNAPASGSVSGNQASDAPKAGAAPVRARKRTFKEQKEFDGIEDEIFALEARKEELEALLSGGESDHTKLADYGREYAALTPQIDEKYARWEELGALEEY